MSSNRLEISAIIPAYNEELRIKDTLIKYCQFWRSKNVSFEILVVLNGCTDNSAHLVKGLMDPYPEIRLREYPQKLGKGGALIEGLKYVAGKLIVHTDADGSTDASDIMKLIDNLGDADAIIGSRWLKDSEVIIKQSLFRQLASRVFNVCTRIILGLPYSDTQCGAKVYRLGMIQKIVLTLNTTNYAMDACILYQAQRHGFKVKEYPIRWHNEGNSKVNVFKHAPGMLFAITLTRLNDLAYRSQRISKREEIKFQGWKDDLFYPNFTIIIPCRTIDTYTKECIENCYNLDYKKYEILLLPDEQEQIKIASKNTTIIPTGKVKPSVKRNLGVKRSNPKTDIIAFIDADSYPDPDWLKNSIYYLRQENVGAIGGPNVTPPDDSILQKVSGDIFSMPVAVGQFALRYQARYRYRKRQPVREMPSVNLLVKKELIEQIGGFDTTLLTAEDAKLCFEIQKQGKKIIYAPDVIVYHHRRTMFLPHLKQVWIYGRDKMWLIKEDFCANKLYYFIPFLFLMFQLFGAISIAYKSPICYIYYYLMFLYIILILVASLQKSLTRSYLIFPGIMLTHLSYGFGSLYGLITKRKGGQ